MKQERKKLGDAELDIMLAIWQAPGPVTSTWLLEQLRGKRDWPLSALMTTLARLADKGFVACDRSTRTNYYSALVSEAEYKARESSSFLQRLHAGSLPSLVAGLYGSQAIGNAELEELRALIDTLEGGDQDG